MILDASVKKVFHMELYIPDEEYKIMSEKEIDEFIFSEAEGVDYNDIEELHINEKSERKDGLI